MSVAMKRPKMPRLLAKIFMMESVLTSSTIQLTNVNSFKVPDTGKIALMIRSLLSATHQTMNANVTEFTKQLVVKTRLTHQVTEAVTTSQVASGTHILRTANAKKTRASVIVLTAPTNFWTFQEQSMQAACMKLLTRCSKGTTQHVSISVQSPTTWRAIAT